MDKQNNSVMTVANDLGYGAVKMQVDDEFVLAPSVLAVEREQDLTSPVEFDNEEEQDQYMDQLLNQLDVTVSSSAVKRQGRFFVGQAAVESQLPLTMFDVNDFTGKADDDLALILTLSLIAGKRVKEAYFANEDLSSNLKVTVNMATALPINEGKQAGVKERYQQKYVNQRHQVTFHNFADPITVDITFRRVYVALEGETAQLFIRYANPALKEALASDFKENYPELAKQVTIDDVINADNLLGIDIGEGTTDLVSIINGRANATASSSLAKGYGNVLQQAIDVLQAQQMNFDSRTALQGYLSSTVSPFAKKHQARVQAVVYQQLEPFADQIVDAVSKTMRTTGAQTELVFVYGGGAIPMLSQSQLRNKLVAKLRNFNGGDDLPVIWINQEFAQLMNMEGLKLIASEL
ncbi:ParM/StbA family protein [Pediococcus parvulus]|uniref:ParM/StbA family protein n=1 Tax=Pediococcus parvulus TaxID=54062 RepID=UPI0021A8E3A2|nr:ParM/StbA family protein [Pediococcus parvulus]MCT3034235.1 ParM/StbA family protein [Pediococcus parvulus]